MVRIHLVGQCTSRAFELVAHFYVLEGDVLFQKHQEDSLNEWTELVLT